MWKEIKACELNENVFQLIGKTWTLIAAENKGRTNAMTASWGGLGILWNKNVATVYIRPQRFTKGFIDHGTYFSLSFFKEEYRSMLSYMGTVSGRDEDKIEKSGLTVLKEHNAPYFEEAYLTLICKKLYAQDLKSSCFLDNELDDKNYPEKDYHTMYIAEIMQVLVNE